MQALRCLGRRAGGLSGGAALPWAAAVAQRRGTGGSALSAAAEAAAPAATDRASGMPAAEAAAARAPRALKAAGTAKSANLPLFAQYAAQHHAEVASAADFAALKERFLGLSAADLAVLEATAGSVELPLSRPGYRGPQLYARWHMDEYTGSAPQRAKKLHAAYVALPADDRAALNVLARYAFLADHAGA